MKRWGWRAPLLSANANADAGQNACFPCSSYPRNNHYRLFLLQNFKDRILFSSSTYSPSDLIPINPFWASTRDFPEFSEQTVQHGFMFGAEMRTTRSLIY